MNTVRQARNSTSIRTNDIGSGPSVKFHPEYSIIPPDKPVSMNHRLSFVILLIDSLDELVIHLSGGSLNDPVAVVGFPP